MPNLTDEENRLGERARAAMGPWQTGMVEAGGAVVARTYGAGFVTWATDGDFITDLMEPDEDDTPGLSAPSTQGCLFARVQEVLSLTELEALGHVMDIMVNRGCGCGYAEALVVALEAGR